MSWIEDNLENETLEAKLRNQLSPIYGLVDMILLMEEKPEIKELLIKQAKQAVTNKEIIDLLLAEIEAKTLNKPAVIRQVCTIGGECKVRGENNECKGTAYCGYKKHTFL